MIDFFFNEEFRDIPVPEGACVKKYAVSNYGRLASYTTDINEGRILKGGVVNGYPVIKINYKNQPTKDKTFFVHKLVAELFIPRPSEDHVFVLHRDFSKDNNMAVNLFWGTKDDRTEHIRINPKLVEHRKARQYEPVQVGLKLTATDIMRVKKKIFDPNRKTRMKIIAKQFGISEMQLYRIRSGENWSHVKVEVLGEEVATGKEFEALMARHKQQNDQ